MLASGAATPAVTSGAALARLSVSFAITVKLREATNEAVQREKIHYPCGMVIIDRVLLDVGTGEVLETASTFTETGGLDHLCPALDAARFFH